MGRSRGARTVLLASNPFAALAPKADVPILVNTGPEAITGSTRMKAGTAQKMVLNTFSTAVMVRLGKTYSNLMVEVLATNEKLRKRLVRLLTQATDLEADVCENALAATDGDLRAALVMLVAGVDGPRPWRRSPSSPVGSAARRCARRWRGWASSRPDARVRWSAAGPAVGPEIWP